MLRKYLISIWECHGTRCETTDVFPVYPLRWPPSVWESLLLRFVGFVCVDFLCISLMWRLVLSYQTWYQHKNAESLNRKGAWSRWSHPRIWEMHVMKHDGPSTIHFSPGNPQNTSGAYPALPIWCWKQTLELLKALDSCSAPHHCLQYSAGTATCGGCFLHCNWRRPMTGGEGWKNGRYMIFLTKVFKVANLDTFS